MTLRTCFKTLLVAALSSLLFAGCGDATARTQVTLFVDGDTVVRAETVSMRVEFFEPDSATATYVETVPMTNWPVTFALIQRDQEEFVAHVYALDAGGEIVAEGVAWSSFVPRSTRFFQMFLTRSPCTSAMIEACDNDHICQTRDCVQVPFTPGRDLPEDQNPRPIDAGTDNSTPDMGPDDMGPDDMGPNDMGPDDMGPDDMGMVGDCTLGATRPCGSDVGACTPGTQTCGSDMMFGACEGAVGPAAETCNGMDDDCDGTTDDVAGAGVGCGTDVGACSMGTTACVGSALGCVGGITPVAETCNTQDDDCDGDVDDGVQNTYSRDADGDMRGNPSMSRLACSAPAGWVSNTDDCNDACATCWTGRAETCDGLDNNCTAGIDEGVLMTFYRDADGDMRGTPSMTMMACTPPSGHVADSSDCNDACSACWTGRTEVCDALDNNCTGGTDETFACIRGSAQTCTTSCGSMGTGVCSSTCSLPTAATCTPPVETCDNVDQDCDTRLDEGLIVRTGQGDFGIGQDAKMANVAGGYVAVRTRLALGLRLSEAYRVDSLGVVRGDPAFFLPLESEDVRSVDIDAATSSRWSVVSAREGEGVQHRLLRLNTTTGNPTIVNSLLVGDATANGMARVAMNSALSGMVIYSSSSGVKTAVMDATGTGSATDPSGTLLATPGSHREELGMDVAWVSGSTFMITWVAEVAGSAQIHVALRTGGSTTSVNLLGAGSYPSLVRDAGGNFGLVYRGSDNIPQFHHLTPTVTCLQGGGAADTCRHQLGFSSTITPNNTDANRRPLDIAADGNAFWVSQASATNAGVMLFRASRQVTHDSTSHALTGMEWISVGAENSRPLVMRGINTPLFYHDTYGCP